MKIDLDDFGVDVIHSVFYIFRANWSEISEKDSIDKSAYIIEKLKVKFCVGKVRKTVIEFVQINE